MNTCQRIAAVFSGRKPDRLPNVEFGYWDETLRLWHTQGLPAEIHTDAAVERYLDLEGLASFHQLPVSNGLFPPFEETVLSDDGSRRIFQDAEGNLCETLLAGSTMPRYIKFGLQDRADWIRRKRERLDMQHPGRIGDVGATLHTAQNSGRPTIFHAGSLYGWLRNWMGLEAFSYALMEDRPWIEEMMDHLVELTLAVLRSAVPVNRVDLGWWWEDMCYNRGPLMSPRLFGELLVPRYRVITAEMKRLGITTQVLDCDGRIDALVPGWLEAGINCMFPLEAAHTDAYRLRDEFGDDLLLLGGVDKLALIQGKAAIDREIDRLGLLVERGRFIPCLDHRVPADVTFENYLYYLEKKKALLLR